VTTDGLRGTRIAFPGDVWGAFASMLVAVPSSIAFGVLIFSAASPGLVSAGAMAGLAGAAALGLVAPLVSRNAGMITAPCAPAAAVLSGFAMQLRDAHVAPAHVIALITLTAFASGLLQVLFGVLGAGRLIKYIPYQVASGYMSGVALIIAIAQIPRFLGIGGGARFFDAMIAPQRWHWPAIVVGTVAIAAMTLGSRVTKVIPATIIGLVASIGAYFAIAFLRPDLHLLVPNPLVIGYVRADVSLHAIIESRLLALVKSTMSDLVMIAAPAITLSILLSFDTLKTGVVLDAMLKERQRSDRELVGQGVANVVSFLTGGVPGAGTTGPTLVNVSSGARTWWSGVIEGVLVIITAALFTSAIAWVPIATLAGILLVIAARMFDVRMFRLLLQPSARFDFFVIAAVIVVAVGIGLIQAALVGIGLAIMLFIRNQMRGSVIYRKADLRQVRSKRRRIAEENRILEERGGDALLVQLRDDLFFGTTDSLFVDLEQDLAERRFILLDFRRVQSMDYTAVRLLDQMQTRLRERGGELLFSGMPSHLPTARSIASYMKQLGLVGAPGGIRVFDTRDSALEWIEQQVLASASWVAGESKPPLGVGEIDLFRGLDPPMLEELERSMREVCAKAGTKLFAAGDPGDEIFFVRSGRVHVLLPLEGNVRHHLATICRGDFFGEMAFLDRESRSADAEAATNTELFVLSRAVFDATTQSDPLLASRVLERFATAIAKRLRVADSELRALEER
jgi:SulP family sulfate permease